MMARLLARGAALGAARARALAERLEQRAVLPRGIRLLRSRNGLVLSGKRLRWRFATEPRVRDALRLAQGVMP